MVLVFTSWSQKEGVVETWFGEENCWEVVELRSWDMFEGELRRGTIREIKRKSRDNTQHTRPGKMSQNCQPEIILFFFKILFGLWPKEVIFIYQEQWTSQQIGWIKLLQTQNILQVQGTKFVFKTKRHQRHSNERDIHKKYFFSASK